MGIKLEMIYNYSPIFFQNIMTSVAGYRNSKSRYGKEYLLSLEKIRHYYSLTNEEKELYQLEKLKDFLIYIKANSAFYKNKYKDIDFSNIDSINFLELLPPVSKEELRNNIDDIITVKKKDAIEVHTGGTTGKSLAVYYTKKDMMDRMATLDYFKAQFGFINNKMKKATFNGKQIIPGKQRKKVFWRYNIASKQMIYSSFFLSEENIPHYIESLNNFKPIEIDGFFTAILDIANYIIRHNIKMEFKPVGIFPTSETLTEEGRKVIEKAFQSKVYDQYASSEGAPFVFECTHGNLHLDLYSGIIETKKNSDEILITSFTTHGTPLVRYDIGDVMRLEDRKKYVDVVAIILLEVLKEGKQTTY